MLKNILFFLSIIALAYTNSTKTTKKTSNTVNADIFIDVTVIGSSDTSTISEFSIDNDSVVGYFMEREAGTKIQEKKAGTGKRIPPSTYLFIENDCNLYKDRPKKRPECAREFRLITSTVKDAGTRDGILIHLGNSPGNISGCLIPGTSYEFDKEFKKRRYNNKTMKYKTSTFYTDWIENSSDKLDSINAYIERRTKQLKKAGKKNITMKIRLR